jgi:glycosyltransferase involved in cell wall biosynthesis
MRVLVAHPGLQHSHQLAAALEQAGVLAGFWSGVPVTDARGPHPEFWARVRPSTPAVPVPARRRRHAVLFPLLRRAAATLLPPGAANSACHRIEGSFDQWTARRVSELKPDMVVCYENAALETFRAAKGFGAICVLDAAAVHYSAARAWGGISVRANPSWIDRRKQQEIEAADAILTCSELAAETYRAAGVPTSLLYPIALGTELPAGVQRLAQPGALCRFVFAGSVRRLKGIDLLLDVFEQLARENVPAQLTLIGGAVETDLVQRANTLGNVAYLPFIPRESLFHEMAQHDCLLLPSRFDSFGMVVAEAMAVGVQALVTERVGAKCIIEEHPGSGWIVPVDAAAIKAQILWLMAHRAELAQASAQARSAAQAYTWHRYGARARSALLEIYERRAKGAK